MPDTLRERLLCGSARLMGRLPGRVLVTLSGEPHVIVDGQRLDPLLQLLRRLRRRLDAVGLLEPTISAGRQRYRRTTRVFRGPMTDVGAVRDFAIPGPVGPLRVRHYAPAHEIGVSSQRAAPLTVYLHGGGFVIGDLDTHDEPCRILCRHAGVHVLSVDYRLAPEHPFPAAVEDAVAAFGWARGNANALHADAERVAIAGDSAGATLAAVVSNLAAEDARPVAQLLIYPATDLQTRRPSHELFGETFFLTRADCNAFYHHYVNGVRIVAGDPRLSVINAPNLSTAPPALVVLAGFDILRDEGEAYAAALQKAGVAVDVVRVAGLEHGFIHLTGVCTTARRAMLTMAHDWSAILGRARQVGGAGQGGQTGRVGQVG